MEFGQQIEEDKPPSYDDVAGDEANVGVTTEVGEESVIYQVSQNNSRQGGRKQLGCRIGGKKSLICLQE